MNDVKQTLISRTKTYGSFECNATLTTDLDSVLRNHKNYEKLSPVHKETFHMIFHKMARILCGDPEFLDSTLDLYGYAKLLHNFVEEKNNPK